MLSVEVFLDTAIMREFYVVRHHASFRLQINQQEKQDNVLLKSCQLEIEKVDEGVC